MTKRFVRTLSLSLGPEFRELHVDTLLVQPGLVSTNINGNYKMFGVSSTVENCAEGILKNSFSGMTYGSTLHNFHGFIMELVVDLLFPQEWTI